MASPKWNTRLQESGLRYKKQPGDFGVEIEAEGFNLPQAVFGWDVHREGSLRGEAKEYVTVGAVTMEELEESMEILTQAIKDNRARVDEESYRASTHIHVNVQRFTHMEIMGSILTFLMVEPVWMRLCGENRDGNLFCLSSYDCGDMADYVESFVNSIEQNGHIVGAEQRGKYASLNTLPLHTFGTLEFRTFPCSVTTEKVMEWARWCQALVDVGKRMKHPGRDLQAFYDRPQDLLYSIFGPEAIDSFNLIDLMSMVEVGAENAFESIRAFQHAIDKNAKKAA